MVKKCLKKFSAIIFALITRGLFCIHVLVALWSVVFYLGWSNWYIFLFAGVLGLGFETVYTVYFRKGQEYKWFCPSAFCYLASVVPCIWLLEMNILMENNTDVFQNSTDVFQNSTDDSTEQSKNNLIDLPNIKLPEEIQLKPKEWMKILEQLLLFILILGRWMLPKGKISRDELSELLLVYLGMAADIIEFLDGFKENEVKNNKILIISILSIWSASLFQFTLVLTASKSQKSRAGFHTKKLQTVSECCDIEIIGIMTTLFLQDGPFLGLRLLLLFRYNVMSYMHIFFTVKNSTVCLLIFYRLFVVVHSRMKRNDEETNDDKAEYLNLDGECNERPGNSTMDNDDDNLKKHTTDPKEITVEETNV